MKPINKPLIKWWAAAGLDPCLAMAADEYLLDRAQQGEAEAYFRLYTMQPPALTIGYFFKTKHLIMDRIEKDRVRVVRRITGGNGVLHEADLTYSFICPKGLYGIQDNKSLYLFMARILQGALKKAGLDCTIQTDTQSGVNDPHCFGSVSQYEITGPGGEKVVGSAQKLLERACIQQGTIFYASNPQGALEYLKSSSGPALPLQTGPARQRQINSSQIGPALQAELADFFTLEEFTPTRSDREKLEKLVREKYADFKWNFGR